MPFFNRIVFSLVITQYLNCEHRKMSKLAEFCHNWKCRYVKSPTINSTIPRKSKKCHNGQVLGAKCLALGVYYPEEGIRVQCESISKYFFL